MIKKIEFIFEQNPLNSGINQNNSTIYFNNSNISLNDYNKKISHLLYKNKEFQFLIFKIWEDFFNEKLILKKTKEDISKIGSFGIKSLKFSDLIYLDIIIFLLSNKDDDFYIPITIDFLRKNDPIIIYKIAERILEEKKQIRIFFITNDLYWASIFTDKVYRGQELKKIPIFNFYWVESELDLFTYSVFFPNKKFKVAGSSSNIFEIMKRNPSHKSIIDKDGFTLKNISYLKENFELYFTNMAECENIWLHSDLIKKLNSFSPKEIKISDFKEEIMYRAEKNLETTLMRFKNRQDYLMYNYIPYLNDMEIFKFRENCIKDLNNKDYNSILTWFDNKRLFLLYIKEAGYGDIKTWKKDILKNKEIFFNYNNNIIY